jgi:hypothetical protein
MNVIHCPHCGTTNRAGSNFCNRCGANLRGDDVRESASTAAAADTPPVEGAWPPPETDELSSPTATDEPAFAQAPPHPAEERSPLPWADALPTTEIHETAQAEAAASTAARRLITGVQGLLEPLQIASERNDQRDARTASPPVSEPFALDNEQLRRIRTLLTEDPVLLDMPLAATPQATPRLHLPWLMGLLSLLIGVPILLDLFGPIGTPQAWPGVAEAHAVIEGLPAAATVLVVWAYDPATAAEMDLVALPLASHLLERRVQPVLVSQLPGGLATAQRLFERAVQGLLADKTFRFTTDRELYIQAGYLPGGAALLAWLAQDPAAALLRHVPSAAATLPLPGEAVARPALTIIVAAQAEAVQQWLEQGQPLQYAPTLAFTSAGADPWLRPYLASGQLSGLVSGFDGALTYQGLRTVPLAVPEVTLLSRQLIFQNWGHLALFLVLLLGNLVAWWSGGAHG